MAASRSDIQRKVRSVASSVAVPSPQGRWSKNNWEPLEWSQIHWHAAGPNQFCCLDTSAHVVAITWSGHVVEFTWCSYFVFVADLSMSWLLPDLLRAGVSFPAQQILVLFSWSTATQIIPPLPHPEKKGSQKSEKSHKQGLSEDLSHGRSLPRAHPQVSSFFPRVRFEKFLECLIYLLGVMLKPSRIAAKFRGKWNKF